MDVEPLSFQGPEATNIQATSLHLFWSESSCQDVSEICVTRPGTLFAGPDHSSEGSSCLVRQRSERELVEMHGLSPTLLYFFWTASGLLVSIRMQPCNVTGVIEWLELASHATPSTLLLYAAACLQHF
jgi:hypothetical protein